MKEYRQNAINYVKENVECVGYRDYIVEQLEVPAIPLERIKQLRERVALEKFGYAQCQGYYRAIEQTLELIDNVIKEYI